DHELVLLDGHIELVAGEAGDRERDAQPFGFAVGAGTALDVIGRIAVRPFDDAVEHPLDFVEPKEKRAGQRWNTTHCQSPLGKRLWWVGALAAPHPAGAAPPG